MKASSFSFTTHDRVVLRGLKWAGAADTLVLLHEPGENCDLELWRPLLPYLFNLELTIIAIDLRGHGASDGQWSRDRAGADIEQAIQTIRRRGAQRLLCCAAGESAVAALEAVDRVKIDGLILLSPIDFRQSVSRGAGEPKLVISAAKDTGAREAGQAILSRAIGPTMVVTVPGEERGATLLNGSAGVPCREHILQFFRERLAESKSVNPASHIVSSRFGERLGLPRKGPNE